MLYVSQIFYISVTMHCFTKSSRQGIAATATAEAYRKKNTDTRRRNRHNR